MLQTERLPFQVVRVILVFFYSGDSLHPSSLFPLETCVFVCFSHILNFADVPEGSFIVRAHTPMSNLFSCLWFNEVDRYTSRDQLSFAYTFLKLKRMNPDRPFFLNMFKVRYLLK